jgi:urease accessory protein
MSAVEAGAIDRDAINGEARARDGEGWRDGKSRRDGPGWQARLQLRFEADAGRTRLAYRRHQGPLMVQRVFYPEATAATAHAYLLHPPGGVVSGDQLQLDVEVGRDAHALLTTPAAGKYYRHAGMDSGDGVASGGIGAGAAGGARAARVARTTQTLRVSGGVLEWLPQENIFYPDSAVQLSTQVRLDDGARFIGWEIGCMGLPAIQATLGRGTVRQAFELWQRDAPLLLERLNIDRSCLGARFGLAGHAALGTWLAFPATGKELALARAVLARAVPASAVPAPAPALAAINCADMMLACTLVDGVLSCRGTACRADRLKQAFVDLWRALRPSLLGRAAIAPRIWAT